MHALRLRRPHSRQRKLGRGRGDRGGDAGDVEPGRAFEGLVPIDVAHASLGDAGLGTVIDDLGGALVGAGLQEVDAHAAGRLLKAAHVHAKAAQLLHAGLADVVIRDDGHEGRVHAVVGQGHSDVRFAAAKGGLQRGALEEALERGALQTQHDFTESNYTSHWNLSF